MSSKYVAKVKRAHIELAIVAIHGCILAARAVVMVFRTSKLSGHVERNACLAMYHNSCQFILHWQHMFRYQDEIICP